MYICIYIYNQQELFGFENGGISHQKYGFRET